MSDDDIPAEQIDDSSATDATEPATDGGAVKAEGSQSRFWGVIPSEWELVEGSEVYDVNPPYTPEEEQITYIEMDALDTELPFPKYTKKRNAADYSGKLFREGDTLFARITPCTENGKTAFVDEMETDVGIGSTEYAILSPDCEYIHPLYLYYVAKSHPVRNYAISRMRGSTGRQRVPFDVFRRELDISLPPMDKQQEIASILYNIDEIINKSRRITQKTQTLGKGIRRDLFSKGYYEHKTNSRGSLGEVPSDWETLRLHEVSDVARGKFTHRPRNDPAFYGGDYPFVQTGDVAAATGELAEYSQTLNDKGLEVSKQFDPGTVIITIAGNIGDTAVATFPVSFPDSLVGITPNEDVDEYFLEHYLRYRKDFLNRLSTKTTQKNLNLSLLRPTEVVKPPLDEQKKIAEVLSAIDERILEAERYNAKLSRIKRGLMQDLLSGNVRTGNIEPVDEVIRHG